MAKYLDQSGLSYFYQKLKAEFNANFASVSSSISNGTIKCGATRKLIGDEYKTDITPADGYYISAITVTMNGVDITDQVFTGVPVDDEPEPEPETNIPLNEQLIDYTAVQAGYDIDDNGNIVTGDAWDCVTDYTAVDSTMTFSFMCNQYANIGFYDSGKNAIGMVRADYIKDSAESYVAQGSLTPSIIPQNAKYVVMVGNSYGASSTLSLIRTA